MLDLGINFQSDLHVPSANTTVDTAFFNRRFKKLYDALQAMNEVVSSYGAAEATLIQLGLARLNETLSPLLITLQEAANLGFQTAKSEGDAQSLTEGAAIGWQLTSGFDLFAPTPYLLAQDDDDATNWGILSLDEGGFTRTTGELATHVVYASKTASAENWTISTNNAVIPVAISAMQDAIAAKNDAEAALATITADMATIQDLIDAVADGPVASVNGQTGEVSLAVADILGLTATLAGKASTGSLSSKQDASAKLTALVNLAWTANAMIYATGAGSLGTLPISTFSKEALGDENAGARLTRLGFSEFVKTLVDDANADAALDTLGFSAFGKAWSAALDVDEALTLLNIPPYAPTIVTIPDSASQTFNAQSGLTKVARQAATSDRTINPPTNPVDGQLVIIEFSAVGANRLLDLSTATGGFRFGADVPLLTTTTIGKTDRIGVMYNFPHNKWDVISVTKGF